MLFVNIQFLFFMLIIYLVKIQTKQLNKTTTKQKNLILEKIIQKNINPLLYEKIRTYIH